MAMVDEGPSKLDLMARIAHRRRALLAAGPEADPSYPENTAKPDDKLQALRDRVHGAGGAKRASTPREIVEALGLDEHFARRYDQPPWHRTADALVSDGLLARVLVHEMPSGSHFLGRKRWNPRLHPRDRVGKFIRIGGVVKLHVDGHETRGEVTRISENRDHPDVPDVAVRVTGPPYRKVGNDLQPVVVIRRPDELERVVEAVAHLTPEQRRRQREEIDPLGAAGKFNPDLHPRGADGKFIDVLGWVFFINPSDRPDASGRRRPGARGQVTNITPDPQHPGNPIITVKLKDANGNEYERQTTAHTLIQAPSEKARLDEVGGAIEREQERLTMLRQAKAATPEQTGGVDVVELMANNPRRPDEGLFAWQSRLVDQLDPQTKSDVLFEIREKPPPVDFMSSGVEKWINDHGLEMPPLDEIRGTPVDLNEADSVARFFEHAPDMSGDPRVKRAYEDLKKQSDEMYDFLTKPESQGGLGVKVEFTDKVDPYTTAGEQAADIQNNHHMWIQRGLGGAHEATMTQDEYDRFRAVHDAFGHAAAGTGFDRHGEYQAWLVHAGMYSGLGRDAMSTEYHGVNSALWSGEPGTPGTGKSLLLPEKWSKPPWARDTTDTFGGDYSGADFSTGGSGNEPWSPPEMGSARPDAFRSQTVLMEDQHDPPRPGMGDTVPLRPMRTGVDSIASYIDPETGQLTPERAKLHDEIVEAFVSGKPRSKDPTLILMGGGPAAGKSTLLDSGLVGGVPSRDMAAFASADDIKSMLPEGHQMEEEGDGRWSTFTHEESSYLAKRVIAASQERGIDVILDGTGDSYISGVISKIEAARANGYKVKARYVTVPTEMAVQRSHDRFQATGRAIPDRVLRGTHSNVSKIFPALENEFDDVELWDTSGDTPHLIFRGGNTVDPEVLDNEAYMAFLAKAEETVGEATDVGRVGEADVATPAGAGADAGAATTAEAAAPVAAAADLSPPPGPDDWVPSDDLTRIACDVAVGVPKEKSLVSLDSPAASRAWDAIAAEIEGLSPEQVVDSPMEVPEISTDLTRMNQVG